MMKTIRFFILTTIVMVVLGFTLSIASGQNPLPCIWNPPHSDDDGDGAGQEGGGDCDDGIDNDGDGLTDCADADCAAYCDEDPIDGVDNDGDGAGQEGGGDCNDGIDNDSDGLTDCADTDCADYCDEDPKMCDWAACDAGGGPCSTYHLKYLRSHDLLTPNANITRAIIVVHSRSYSPLAYYNNIFNAANDLGLLNETLIIAPFFPRKTLPNSTFCHQDTLCWSTSPEHDDWVAGGNSDNDPTLRTSSFYLLDDMVNALADLKNDGTFPNLSTIVVTGQSGGGQCALRYAMAGTAAPAGIAMRYVPCNPGEVTYLNALRPTEATTDAFPNIGYMRDCDSNGTDEPYLPPGGTAGRLADTEDWLSYLPFSFAIPPGNFEWVNKFGVKIDDCVSKGIYENWPWGISDVSVSGPNDYMATYVSTPAEVRSRYLGRNVALLFSIDDNLYITPKDEQDCGIVTDYDGEGASTFSCSNATQGNTRVERGALFFNHVCCYFNCSNHRFATVCIDTNQDGICDCIDSDGDGDCDDGRHDYRDTSHNMLQTDPCIDSDNDTLCDRRLGHGGIIYRSDEARQVVFFGFTGPETQWSYTYGGGSRDKASSVRQTQDGGYVVAGERVIDASGSDIWIAKLDSDGTVEWERRYDTGGDEKAVSILTTCDGGYMVAGTMLLPGATVKHMLVMKLDANGDMEWRRGYGPVGFDFTAAAMEQSNDGNYILAGTMRPPDLTDADVWVIKLDPSGTILWQRWYGGSGYVLAGSIQPTGDGGYILGADAQPRNGDFWIVKLDTAGNIEWQKRFGLNWGGTENWEHPPQVKQTFDGGYIVAGETQNSSFPLFEGVWVLKLDSQGNIQWQKKPRNVYGVSSLEQTDDLGYILSGNLEPVFVPGQGNFMKGWAMKLDASGNVEWKNRYGGNDLDKNDYLSSMLQTRDGGYITVGITESFGVGDGDAWVLKLDANGLVPDCPVIESLGGDWDLTVESAVDTSTDPGWVTPYIGTPPMTSHVSSTLQKDGCHPTVPDPIDLAKTGQTTCYYPGDDGHLQAGVAWPSPRFTDNGDGTLTDELTGLVWLRDGNCAGTIGHDPQATGNGSMYWQDALDFVAGINDGTYSSCGGGHTDWRLPNLNELASLVNAEEAERLGWLNGQGFANVATSGGGRYWSSDSFSNWLAWSVGGSGWDLLTTFRKDSDTHFVWPVRAGQQVDPDPAYPANVWRTGQIESYYPGDDGDLQMGVAWPSDRFIVNGDGTVTDGLTGLMWIQNSDCFGSLTWEEALNTAVGFSLNPAAYGCEGYTASYDDWRLANFWELWSLIDLGQWYPHLPAGHPFEVSTWNAWSSTVRNTEYPEAWFAELNYGNIYRFSMITTLGVWLVRGGTSRPYLETAPDLIITDVWDDGQQICYQIRNIGDIVAPFGHSTSLSIDDNVVGDDLIDVALLPGERLTRCFTGYTWNCSSLNDAVHITADSNQAVLESDETNNSRDEEWQCDTTAPLITTSPLVSQTILGSADISWSTDTPSNSMVMYGTAGGVFEAQAIDQQQIDTHLVHLDNLEPSKTYHYVVLSSDESGNTVKSKEGYFKTDPVPDDTPPEVVGLQVTKGAGDILYYMMAADATDNIGVQRVEFFMDGALECVDYKAPFECQIAPIFLDLSPQEFFKEHTVEAVAYDQAGMPGVYQSLFEPAYECQDIRAHMEAPFPNHVHYIEGTTVPAGTTIPIRVRASIPKFENCEYRYLPGLHPGAITGELQRMCDEVENVVWKVRFSAPGLEETKYPTGLDYDFAVDWDISGFSWGTYNIRVDVFANEECIQTLTNTYTIEQGEPELDITREVTRIGNYFQVDLKLENIAGTGSVDFDLITDGLSGFQPIAKSEADYDVKVSISDLSKFQEFLVIIDFAGSHFTLEPGKTKQVSYLAVPVMYPPDQSVEYGIGDRVPISVLNNNNILLYEFDRPCETIENGVTLSTQVYAAHKWSDYLIVTNPVNLSSAFPNNPSALAEFLSSTAELARYRNGILGYLNESELRFPGRIKECISAWGAPMSAFNDVGERVAGGYLSNGGYLLLVGETEIIPSFYREFAHRPCTKHDINWTDMPYGDMSGDLDPELSVGRIIGDTLAEMKLPIEASINVVKGEPGFEFDRSDALLASGPKRGDDTDRDLEKVEQSLDEIGNIIDDEFFITKIKSSEVVAAGSDMTTEFKNNDGNKDALVYRGHCNTNRWSGVIDTGDFGGADSIDFEDAKPFSFALCCQSGQYEDDFEAAADQDSIAESFLQNGSPVYIGATENSYRGQNISSGKWFYNHWVNTTKTVGQTFRELKVHLDRCSGDYWSYEYNLYGDPKYGRVETMAAAAFSVQQDIPVPPSPYEIVIPDYEVNTVDDEHHVSIPEGNMLLEADKPAVPFYKVSIECPVGYTVQDVRLLDRSGLVTATGLNIPLVTMKLDADDALSTASSGGGEEWWPSLDEVFEYKFETRHDGTSLLTITLFPFYYNSLTTDVKFYKNYTFDIQGVASDVGIALFTTSKDNYVPGETVDVALTLSGSEIPQDAIAEVVVKDESSGEVVDGLGLRTLSGLAEMSDLSLEWDSTGFAPGSYYLEANIRTSDGGLLYTERKPFNLGISSIKIDDFTVTPAIPAVNTSFTFQNSGSVEISGMAMVKIQDELDATVEIFRHDFTALQPSEILNFGDTWDASGATQGLFRAQAYVLYNSKSTEIRSLAIPICLDLSAVAQAFGRTASDSGYNTYIDFDKDGDVDGLDLVLYKTYIGFGSCF